MGRSKAICPFGSGLALGSPTESSYPGVSGCPELDPNGAKLDNFCVRLGRRVADGLSFSMLGSYHEVTEKKYKSKKKVTCLC